MSKVIGKQQCPQCAEQGRDRHKDNLVMYADGGAYCFACGYTEKGESKMELRNTRRKGKVIQLPEHLLSLDHLGYKYDIPKAVLQRCGVYESPLLDKYDEELDVEGSIAFTFYDDKLRLIGIKYRDFYNEYENGEDKTDCITTQGTICLGGLLTCSRIKRNANKKHTSLCIWEGETDWLVAHKLYNKCDHLFIPGSRHTNKIKEHIMLLREYQTIYIGFDNDEAGDIAMEEVKDMLPLHKLRFIQYGKYNDLVEYINDGNNFIDLLNRAYSDEESDLITGQDLVDHCSVYFDGLESTEIYSTGIEGIDEMLGGGLTPSELVLLAAETGEGKSTLCATLADNLTQDSIKSLWVGSEMLVAQMMRKFIELRSGERYYRNKMTNKWSIPNDERDEIVEELSKDIVFYRQRMSEWERLEESILSAIYQHDVRVIFIDVLSDYLTTDWTKNELIMQRLNWIAGGDDEDGRPPIPIVCVCHTVAHQGKSIRKVTAERIAGGKCVRQKATAIISMQGEVDSMDTTRTLRVLKKSRMNETQRVSSSVYFDKQDRRYYDLIQEDDSREDNVIALPRRRKYTSE